jgi:hypothetical protein
MTVIHLLNRSSTKALDGKAPYKAWHRRKPVVSHLRVFGCLAFAKELNHVGKFDSQSTPGIFIGYAEGVKAYRILDPATQRVRISRDVVFDKGQGWAWDKAVDDGSTSTLRDFVVDYVHFKGARGASSSSSPSSSTSAPGSPSAPVSPPPPTLLNVVSLLHGPDGPWALLHSNIPPQSGLPTQRSSRLDKKENKQNTQDPPVATTSHR